MNVYVLFFNFGKYTNTVMKVYSDLEKLQNYLTSLSRINGVKLELEEAPAFGFYWLKSDDKYVGRVEKNSVIEWDVPHFNLVQGVLLTDTGT